MSKYINNWAPETKALIKSLVAHGCTIVAGSNGEETFPLVPGKEAEFINNLTACDEATIYVRTPGHEGTAWIRLVFGNSPGELASDYTCRPEIEAACTEHSDKWEGRKQPVKLCPFFAKERQRLDEVAAHLNGAMRPGADIYYGGIPGGPIAIPYIEDGVFTVREGVSCGRDSNLLDYVSAKYPHLTIRDLCLSLITNAEGKQLFPRR